MTFRFAQPMAALLLLALPLLAWVFWRRDTGYPFSSLLWMKGLHGRSFRERWHWLDGVVWLAGLALSIVGAMQPQWGKQLTERSEQGIAIVLAVDASRSMAALDFKLNGEQSDRLSVVKQVLRDFVDKRPYDEVGMVIFGELAFTQCPLTTDREIVKTFIDRLQIGMAGDGTAVGDGLALAVKRLENSSAKSKIVILLTDGASNAGRLQPLQAAQFARELGIKVYTIGVGTTGKVPFPDQTPWGTRIVMAKLEIDEKTLTEIASTTNAHYWNATHSEALAEIYAHIDRLEKSDVKVKEFTEYRELYRYAVVPGFIALILFPLLRFGLFKRWIDF